MASQPPNRGEPHRQGSGSRGGSSSGSSGVRLGQVASPPRRREQQSTNNPSYHPAEHPQVLREYAPKYDEVQEIQSPEGTHQSGVFVAQGHAGGGGGAGTTGTEPSSRTVGGQGSGDQQQAAAER